LSAASVCPSAVLMCFLQPRLCVYLSPLYVLIQKRILLRHNLTESRKSVFITVTGNTVGPTHVVSVTDISQRTKLLQNVSYSSRSSWKLLVVGLVVQN